MQPSRLLRIRPVGRLSTHILRAHASSLSTVSAFAQTLPRRTSPPQAPPAHQTRLLRTTPCRLSDLDTPPTKRTEAAAEDSTESGPHDDGADGLSETQADRAEELPELWDTPADYTQTPTLKPPFRLRDLTKIERKKYKTHGPGYIQHVPETLRAMFLMSAAKRDKTATSYRKRWGPGWYDIYSEACLRLFELMRASEEWQRMRLSLEQLHLDLRNLEKRVGGQYHQAQAEDVAKLKELRKALLRRQKEREDYKKATFGSVKDIGRKIFIERSPQHLRPLPAPQPKTLR